VTTVDDTPEEYRQYRFSLPPGASDILLIRHGESLPARPGEQFPMLRGQADPPLDPRGEQEAELVAERLADQHLDAIYVTSLQRTAQTAAPLAARLGMDPIVEPDLTEVHLGEWEGPAFRINVSQAHPIAQELFTTQRWDVIPGAESSEALEQRVRQGLERIAAKHPDRRVAVFTHGGIIGTVAAMATGSQPFAFLGADNGSITHLIIMEDRWMLRRFNDTGHLHTDLDRPPEPLT
jgi:2,3-bisphosphoglycerate-dependent phosphoglycerate mutase